MHNILYNLIILHCTRKYTPTIYYIDAVILAFIGFLVCLLNLGHSNTLDPLYVILYPINAGILLYMVFHANDTEDMFFVSLLSTLLISMSALLSYGVCITEILDHALHHHSDASTSYMTPIYFMGYIYAPIIGIAGGVCLNTHLGKITTCLTRTTSQHAYLTLMQQTPTWLHPYIASSLTSQKA